MKIDVALRYKPFSHEPGAISLIPLTQLQVEVFPALIRIKTFDGQTQEVQLGIAGPMRGFTLQQDLERGWLSVFGRTAAGYLEYRISPSSQGVTLLFKRTPLSGLEVVHGGVTQRVLRGHSLEIALCSPMPVCDKLPTERLSLGVHKAQNWELMRRRLDLREILPFWFRLGQMVPGAFDHGDIGGGALSLLQKCFSFRATRQKLEMEETLRNVIQAGFTSMLMPRLNDDQHQGLVTDRLVLDGISSLALLKKGSELIRALFFEETEGSFVLLPCLLPQLECGRLIDLETAEGDRLYLEWSKKQIRRVVICPASSRQIELVVPTAIQRCRLRQTLQQKGETWEKGRPLELVAGTPLYLDRFEK